MTLKPTYFPLTLCLELSSLGPTGPYSMMPDRCESARQHAECSPGDISNKQKSGIQVLGCLTIENSLEAGEEGKIYLEVAKS